MLYDCLDVAFALLRPRLKEIQKKNGDPSAGYIEKQSQAVLVKKK